MELITKLFHLISAYFEILLAIDVFIFIGLVVIHIAARLHFLNMQRIINTTFYYLLITTQAWMLGLTLLIFFINLGEKRPLDLTLQIEASTRWMPQKQEIFFIHDDQLIAIAADGSNRHVVYQADDLIRQYHFSYKGQYMLMMTERELILFDRRQGSARTIDVVRIRKRQMKKQTGVGDPDKPVARDSAEEHRALKGHIDGIQWAPDDSKFCYRLSQWSDFASIQQWKVYDLGADRKYSVPQTGLRLTALFWGVRGEHLYAGRYTPVSDLDSEEAGFRCRVYRLSFPELRPREVWSGYSESKILPVNDLVRAGIPILIPKRQYAFGQPGQKRTMAYSRQGEEIGVDDTDTLYYSALWWRKRLYRVPRVEVVDDFPRYQYRGGRLTINDLRFLPSGRYVIMEHYFWGILILDPVTGRIGILDNQRGNTFGWYPK